MTAKKQKFHPEANERLTPAEESLYDIIMDTLQDSKIAHENAHDKIIHQFGLFSKSSGRKKLSQPFTDTLDRYIAHRALERETNSIIENQFSMDLFDILKSNHQTTYMILEIILETDPYYFNERGEFALKIPYHDLEKMKEYREAINDMIHDPKYDKVMSKEFVILADYLRNKTAGSEYKKEMQSVLGKRGMTRDLVAQTLRVTSPEFAMLDISDMFYILVPNAIPGRTHGEAAWDLRKQLPDFYPGDPLLDKTDGQTAIKNVLLCYDDLFDFDHNFKSLFEDFNSNREKIWEEIFRLYTAGEIDGKPIERPMTDDDGLVRSIEGLAVDAVYNVRDILRGKYGDHLLPIEKVVTTIEMTSPKPSGFTPYIESEISLFVDLLFDTQTNKAIQRSIWLFKDERGANRFMKKLTEAYRNVDSRSSLGIPKYVKPKNTEGKDTIFTLLSDKVYDHNRLLKGIYRKKNAFIFYDGINYETGQSMEKNDFKQDVYMGFIADVISLTKSLITDQVYRLAAFSNKASMLRGSRTDYPGSWEQDIISLNQTFKHGIDYSNDLLVNFNVISGSGEPEIVQGQIDVEKQTGITEKDRFAKVESRGKDNYYADLKFVIDNDLGNNKLGREFQLRSPLAQYNALKTSGHGGRKDKRQDELADYITSREPKLTKDSVSNTLERIDTYFAYHYLEYLKTLSIPQQVAKLQEMNGFENGQEDIERNMHLAKSLIEGTIKENLIRARYAFPNLTTKEKEKVRGFFLSNPPLVEGFNAAKLNKYIEVRLNWEKPYFS